MSARWRAGERTSRVRTARVRPLLASEALLVGAGYALYAYVRDLHGRSDDGTAARAAMNHGADVERIEATVHLDPERWLQSLVLHHQWVLHAMAVFYLSAHLLVTAGTLLYLYLRRPAVYRRCRNVLALVTFSAVGLFALLPTAPPRLLPGSGLTDTLADTGGLWSYNGGALEHIADPYAAMPSLHLAWSTWVAMSLALALRGKWSRARRAALFGYPVLVTLNVLATGTHWFLDTVAGAALLLSVWAGYAVLAERLGAMSKGRQWGLAAADTG